MRLFVALLIVLSCFAITAQAAAATRAHARPVRVEIPAMFGTQLIPEDLEICPEPGVSCNDNNNCTVGDICQCFGNCTGFCPRLAIEVQLVRQRQFDATDPALVDDGESSRGHGHSASTTGSSGSSSNSANVESCDVGSSGVFFVQCTVAGLPPGCSFANNGSVLIIATTSQFVDHGAAQEDNSHHGGSWGAPSSASAGISTTGGHRNQNKNQQRNQQCELSDVKIAVPCNSFVRISLQETCRDSQSWAQANAKVQTWSPSDFTMMSEETIKKAATRGGSSSTTRKAGGARATGGSSSSPSTSPCHDCPLDEPFPQILADKVILAAQFFDQCRFETVRSPIVDPTVKEDCSRRRRTGSNTFSCCPTLETVSTTSTTTGSSSTAKPAATRSAAPARSASKPAASTSRPAAGAGAGGAKPSGAAGSSSTRTRPTMHR